MSGRRTHNGFTLIELLVAMVIFAVLGTVAYQGLFQVQRVRDAVSIQSEQLAKLQRAFYWLSDDVAQIVDRPVRSTLGSQIPSIVFSEQGENLFEFTRAGWVNPAADILPPRSSLQRVAYSLDGDRLLRSYWYHLDQADEEPTKRRLMLSDVDEFTMRYLDTNGDWHDNWPPSSADLQAGALPAAIEFNIVLTNFGKITRLFALPG